MKNCKHCKSACNGAGRDGYAPNCTYYVTEEKKMTNADWIRSMADEELAEILLCPLKITNTNILCTDDCDGCVLKWLKKEVKE